MMSHTPNCANSLGYFFENKQYITLNNSSLLLYAVYTKRRDSLEYYYQSFSHGANL